MGKEQQIDKFSNTAFVGVQECSANTLTFAELNTGVGTHEKVAWVVSRIDWFPRGATLAGLVAPDDLFDVALCSSSKIDDIANKNDPGVLVAKTFSISLHGTAASAQLIVTPMVDEFGNLPGGGIILTPKPLYLAAKGTSLAVAGYCGCRIHYTQRVLKADEFWELVQASRIVS
ncbi:hypothetical protein ES708_27943 [subsurface metagenome]